MRSRKALLLALGCGILAGGCESPTIGARPEVYEFALPVRDLDGAIQPMVFRWRTGSTIRVHVAPSGDVGRAQLLAAAFAEAANAWNQAVLYDEVRFRAAADADRADVLLAWSDSPLPIDMGNCPRDGGGRAVTTLCLDPVDPTRLFRYPFAGGGPSDIRIVVTVRSLEADDPDRVRRLVAHELGHVLGLAQHPDPIRFPGSVMLALPPTALPGREDRATLQLLYHLPPEISP
jgi:predicted Zn-dependent protease